MPVEPVVTAAGPRRGPGKGAFPAVAVILVLFLAASSAPSPLYVVYQRQWQFTAWVLTVVFALYVIGLLASLLVVGALSDHLGRRPVLAAGIGLEMVAFVLFFVAGDVFVLAVARVLQGIATGAATTTLSAILVDLEPSHARGRAGVVISVAPLTGLALGALGSGGLVEFGPAPTRLVYALLFGGMVLALVVVALMPETSPRRQGAVASLRPRVAMPAYLRADLVLVVPAMIASWALAGMYLSLGPSVAADLLGLHSHLVGGVVVTLLAGTGALAIFLLRSRRASSLLAPSAALLGLGTLISLAGTTESLAWLAAVGTVVAGLGFGASVLATMGTFARIARPHERSAVFALANIVNYLGNSVPAVLGGIAVTALGLRTATVIYALAIVVITFSSFVLRLNQLLAATRSRKDLEVQRSDHTTIRYTASGPGGGRTLVLIHGWACDRNDFDAVTDQLPEDYRVLAVDLAEHGASRSTREVWTMEEFARDVAAVLEAESVTTAVVAGHSLGGAVAVEVGRLLPDTVTHVVALDSLLYLSLFPALSEEQTGAMVHMFREDFAGGVRALVEGGSPAGFDPALKEGYFAKMVAVRQPAGLRAIESLVHWDMDAVLRETKQPITVFAIRDLATREAIDRYGDRFDIVLVDLGSHHFPVEAPEGTAKLLASVGTE
jgi:pimeloyl-ACP methyl ester carboxylesterase/predicted MFS family arabinose efflux permease